jgi:hypothetical protein
MAAVIAGSGRLEACTGWRSHAHRRSRPVSAAPGHSERTHVQQQRGSQILSPATPTLTATGASDRLTHAARRQRQVQPWRLPPATDASAEATASGRFAGSAVAGDTLGQSDYRFDREQDEPRVSWDSVGTRSRRSSGSAPCPPSSRRFSALRMLRRMTRRSSSSTRRSRCVVAARALFRRRKPFQRRRRRANAAAGKPPPPPMPLTLPLPLPAEPLVQVRGDRGAAGGHQDGRRGAEGL